MARSLFLLFISVLTVLVNPIALTAADDVEVVGLNPSGVVETVPLPEPEPEEPTAPSAGVYVVPSFDYGVTMHIASISEYNSVAYNLSYSDIYRFRNLVFAHNSYNLFGNLSSAREGSIVTVRDGGAAQRYRVASIVYYNKYDNGTLENDPYLVNTISRTAMGHSIALMTCAGVPLGNGDATQRLVVYADAV